MSSITISVICFLLSEIPHFIFKYINLFKSSYHNVIKITKSTIFQNKETYLTQTISQEQLLFYNFIIFHFHLSVKQTIAIVQMFANTNIEPTIMSGHKVLNAFSTLYHCHCRCHLTYILFISHNFETKFFRNFF